MKRIIAIVLVMMCALTQVVFAGEISDDIKADLYNLGIMVGDEGGSLNLDNDITRAEAAKVICVAGGISTDEKIGFSDVADTHWAYKYVCAVTENGLMTTDENGCFDPDGTITNEEIVVMAVKLLGYEANAMVMGGENVGYITIGAKIGVTKSLQFEVNTPAKRGDVAVLIYNALDIPVMKREDAEGAVAWRIMDGKGDIPLETLRTQIEK